MHNIISYNHTNTEILPFIVICNFDNDVLGIQKEKLRRSHHYMEYKNVDLFETENRELIIRGQGEEGEGEWRNRSRKQSLILKNKFW